MRYNYINRDRGSLNNARGALQMSDENLVEEVPVDQPAGEETKTFTQADIDEAIRALKEKNNQLLDETKAERKKRQALESAKQEAEQKALVEKEDYKSLYEAEKAKAEEALSGMTELQASIAKGAMEKAATKIGMAIGTGEGSNQELMIEQAAKYIKYEDGKMIYEIGGVEVEEKAVMEFLTKKHPNLTKGLGGTGGGATGSTGSGAAKSDQRSKDIDAAKTKGDLNAFLTAKLTKQS